MLSLITKHQRLAELRPLSPESVASLSAAWDVRMVYESNSIEGNNLTLRETEIVLSQGLAVQGSIQDHFAIKALYDAWLPLKRKAQQGKELDELDLRGTFKALTGKEHTSDGAYYSRLFAGIAASNDGSGTELQYMTDLFLSLPEEPLEKAASIHHRITSKSRFEESSGLIARLAMNFVLLAANYPPISIPTDLREEYYAALKAADSGNFPVWQKFLKQQLHQELDHSLEALEIFAPARP